MDHDVAVRRKMTERYLLDELDPMARDEFEEHFFGCTLCAFDVRAGAIFVEKSKAMLADSPAPDFAPQPAGRTAAPGWFSWLRPAFAVPLMALLVAIVGYQNLVTLPHLLRKLNNPSVLPFASVNVGTYGPSEPVVTTLAGQDFLIFVRIPPENGYLSYVGDLYDPAGKLEWSVTIPASAAQDQWPIRIPGANRTVGTYRLAVDGVDPGGVSKEVGRGSFELQIQK
jgi:hypothetical protein